MNNAPITAFLSYAHEDESYKDELLKFLKPLTRNNVLSVWNDRGMLVGDKWDDEIKNALLNAEIILLLISPSFLASDYINNIEIAMAMDNHKQKKTRIVPIMIRYCDFSSSLINSGDSLKLSDFQGLPTNLKPVKSWEDSDEAWMNVIKGIENLIKFLNSNQ